MPNISHEFISDTQDDYEFFRKQKRNGIIHKKNLIIIIAVLLSIISISGCFDSDSSSDGDKSQGPDSAPTWTLGKFWYYTFSTPELDNIFSKIIVSPDDGTNYQIGVDSSIDAQRHAVLNFNPMLGRVRITDLAVYEKGDPQLIFSFPLEEKSKWEFSLWGIENFQAEVVSEKKVDFENTGKTTIFNIVAIAPSGEQVVYNYDSSAEWIRQLILTDSAQNVILEINLVSYGIGYSGEVYFVRGVDLYDREFVSTPDSPVAELYDSFLDQGHPSWGPFDLLIYYLDITTESDSGGWLTLRDHQSETALHREFGPDYMESSLGTIPSNSGEWTLTVNLEGNAELRMRIAGGIEYIWTV